MEMREWLSIIVIIAIVLIVADGFRRKRKERNPVKLKLDRKVSRAGSSDDDEASAELPHGGARTIPRDLYQANGPSRKKVVRGKQQRKAKMERTLDLEEKVPVLMDSVAIQPEEIDGEEAPPSRFADAAGAAVSGRDGRVLRNGRKSWEDDDDDDEDFDEEDEDLDEEDEDDFDEDEDDDFEDDEEEDEDEDEDDLASTEYDGNDEFDEEYDEDDLDEDEDEDAFGDEDDDYDEEEGEDDDDLDDDEDFAYEEDEEDDNYVRFGRSVGAERVEPGFGNEGGFSAAELENGRFSPQGEAAARAPSRESQVELPLDTRGERRAGESSLGDPEEVIVINVMARKGESFAGKDMLPVIMKQGLRLGDMSIFHRHADSSGNGPVIFSMANMVKPGTFDMAGMEDFTTPGVSLFQQLPGPISNMKNFDRMLAAATAIRDALSGELKDENRSVLTRQTIEHYRQRIRDFELRQLARK